MKSYKLTIVVTTEKANTLVITLPNGFNNRFNLSRGIFFYNSGVLANAKKRTIL